MYYFRRNGISFVPGKRGAFRDVHAVAVCVLHGDVGDVLVVDAGFLMAFLKAQIFEKADELIGVRRDDQRLESCDFHIFSPFPLFKLREPCFLSSALTY